MASEQYIALKPCHEDMAGISWTGESMLQCLRFLEHHWLMTHHMEALSVMLPSDLAKHAALELCACLKRFMQLHHMGFHRWISTWHALQCLEAHMMQLLISCSPTHSSQDPHTGPLYESALTSCSRERGSAEGIDVKGRLHEIRFHLSHELNARKVRILLLSRQASPIVH